MSLFATLIVGLVQAVAVASSAENLGSLPPPSLPQVAASRALSESSTGCWQVSETSESCDTRCSNLGGCSEQDTFEHADEIDSSAEVIALFESLTGQSYATMRLEPCDQ